MTSGLRHHADLNRALDETEARLRALDTPASEPHGDEADQRTARQNVEDVVTERARLEDHRRLVLSALTKIERGTYGECVACCQPIPAKRLDAVPWAERCVPCEERAEESARQRAAQIGPSPPPADLDEGFA